MSDKAPSAWSIERSLQLWHAIREALEADPSLDFDEATILREFEHADLQTPDALLSRLIDAAVWAERREDEADALHKEYQQRRDRYADRKDLLRQTTRQLMEVIGSRKHAGRLGRARIQAGRPSVVILDESALPDECFHVERTASKTAIREKLEAGDDLNGAAVVSNGGEILVITKV